MDVLSRGFGEWLLPMEKSGKFSGAMGVIPDLMALQSQLFLFLPVIEIQESMIPTC